LFIFFTVYFMETQRLLAALRVKQRKSLADLAGPTGFSRTTILRAEQENAPLVWGETLDVIMQKGYGFSPDHPHYRKIVAAWTRDRLSHRSLRRPRGGALTVEERIAALPPAKRKKAEKALKELLDGM